MVVLGVGIGGRCLEVRVRPAELLDDIGQFLRGGGGQDEPTGV